jgi:hypothetical protein
MIARFDHRPMLTAVLALTTTVLVVVIITLTTLLITAAPPTVAPTSVSVDNNPTFPAGYSESYGHEYDKPPKTAQIGDARGSQPSNGNDPVERHAEVIQRVGGGHLR